MWLALHRGAGTMAQLATFEEGFVMSSREDAAMAGGPRDRSNGLGRHAPGADPDRTASIGHTGIGAKCPTLERSGPPGTRHLSAAGVITLIALLALLVLPANVRAADAHGSHAQVLADVHGRLFLNADDGIHGSELWRSDGTWAGTRLVKDINRGRTGSSPGWLTGLGKTAVFVADDGVHGRELWRSDGTTAGTRLVKDIKPGPASSLSSFVASIHGLVLFTADDGVHGTELWRTDGTSTGTRLVRDVRPGDRGARFGPYYPMDLSGAVLYVLDDGVHGAELWRSDGTTPGTALVKDIRPGSEGSWPECLTVVGDTLVFVADDGIHGSELWRSDGTRAGTTLLKDVFPGSDAADAGLFCYTWTNAGATLFFTAYDFTASGDIAGWGLWQTDGTLAGTLPVRKISQGSDPQVSGLIPGWSGVGDPVWFVGSDPLHGNEPWKNTEAGTVLVRDIRPGSEDSTVDGDYSPIRLGDALFLVADDGIHGPELWKSDGTEAGTVLVRDIRPGSDGSRPEYMMVVGDMLVFLADDGIHGEEFWKSDGTEAGTTLIRDIAPGSDGPFGYQDDDGTRRIELYVTDIGGTIFFPADDGVHGWELWRSDGTAAGTRLVRDIDKRPR